MAIALGAALILLAIGFVTTGWHVNAQGLPLLTGGVGALIGATTTYLGRAERKDTAMSTEQPPRRAAEDEPDPIGRAFVERVVAAELAIEHIRFERRAERATDYLIGEYRAAARRNGQLADLPRETVREAVGALLGWLDRHQDTAEGPDDPEQQERPELAEGEAS